MYGHRPFRRWSGPPTYPTAALAKPMSPEWGLAESDADVGTTLPPLLHDLINEIWEETGADRAMIATLALGFAALAVQGLYDQQRPNCEPSSCGLFVLVLANSGARKTTVMRKLAQPYRDFDAAQRAALAEGKSDARTRRRTWEIELKACEREMAKAGDKPEKLESLKLRHRDIIGREEKENLPPQLIYEDTTWSALGRGMSESSPSAAIVNDEASEFFKGLLAPFLAKIDKSWDGSGISLDRSTSDSFTLSATRLTLILALQNRPFQKYIERHGVDAVDLGFLPRFLVVRAGAADRRGASGHKEVSREARRRYHARITRLLCRYAKKIQAGDFTRIPLPMSPGAEAQWNATYEWLAEAMQPNGCLEAIQGYAAKCAENIARVAVVLQISDDDTSTEVSLTNMRRAIIACKAYTAQYLNLFGALHIPVEQCDAENVERWLRDYVEKSGQMEVSTRILRQYVSGGSEFRTDKKRVDTALEYLEVQGKIQRVKYGPRLSIVLNPEFFGQRARAVLPPGRSDLFLPMRRT